MLTQAQYKALKSWPDGVPAYVFPKGLSTRGGVILCGLSTFSKLFRCGLVASSSEGVITKIQPACDNAIREYEEAHNA